MPVVGSICLEGRFRRIQRQKLAYQNKWSLATRSWSEAQSKVRELEKRLNDFTEGRVVPSGMTVEAALQEWYRFRDQNKLVNTKAKQIGEKLVEWCEKNGVLLIARPGFGFSDPLETS